MKDYNNKILNDCSWFAEKYRDTNKQSGAYWSTIIRFTPLFDEAVRLQNQVRTLLKSIEICDAKQNDIHKLLARIHELEEQSSPFLFAEVSLLRSENEQLYKRIAELEEEKQAGWQEWLEKTEKRWDEEDKQERQWIDEGKTLIVKKDGDSWFAVRPDFKDLQQSESRWFSGDINQYMDAVYWYLNDEPQLPQEEE